MTRLLCIAFVSRMFIVILWPVLGRVHYFCLVCLAILGKFVTQVFFWNIFEYKTLVSTSQTNTKTSLPHFSLRKLGDCHLSHKSPRVGLFMDGMLTEKESNHRQLTNLIQFGLIKNPSLCGD